MSFEGQEAGNSFQMRVVSRSGEQFPFHFWELSALQPQNPGLRSLLYEFSSSDPFVIK